MKGGKSRMQRVQVLASGKYKFVKNLTKSKSTPNPKKKASKGGKGGKKVAKKKNRRNRQMTIPLAPMCGLFAGMADGIGAAMRGDYENAINWTVAHYTGYEPWSGQWNPEQLKRGLLPLVAGLLVHKFIGGAPLNLNRILAAAKVPLIRI